MAAGGAEQGGGQRGSPRMSVDGEVAQAASGGGVTLIRSNIVASHRTMKRSTCV
jgi:hypothetical protein